MDLILWIWLSLSCTPGSQSFRKLYEKFGNVNDIYSAESSEISSSIGSRSSDYKALLDKNLENSERIQCFSVPWLKKYNKEWIEKIAECYKNVIENHEALLSPEKDGANQGGRWHGFTNMD